MRAGSFGGFVALGVALVCAACGASRDEAWDLLDRAERIDRHGPRDERRARLDELAAATLAASELVEVRDACVEAHRTLLDAEERQAAAVSAHEAGTTDGRVLDAAASERFVAAMHEASADIERSESLFEACNHGLHSLEDRFGRRP